MRDNYWLNQRLAQIWELLFNEVPKQNNIKAIFRGKSRNKFGHIKLLKDSSTEIAVNSLFKSELVPEYIIDLTLAHELVHYSHGFNSPLPKLHQHPHRGSIVERELIRRGFGEQSRKEKEFVKTQWPLIYRKLMPNVKRRRIVKYNSLFRFFRL